MNEFLREHGVQFKQGKTWILYQKYDCYRIVMDGTKNNVKRSKLG